MFFIMFWGGRGRPPLHMRISEKGAAPAAPFILTFPGKIDIIDAKPTRKEHFKMKYDFTSILDRRGRDAIAVDMVGKPGFGPDAPLPGFDTIPMWVADMNFPTVPTVCEAIAKRAAHPAFGYFSPRKEYFDAIIAWQRDRNGVTGLGGHRLPERGSGRCGCCHGNAMLRRRCHPGTFPGIHGVYPRFGESRLSLGQKSSQAGCAGHLADGSCGYGGQNRGEQHPRCHLLFPS